MSIGRAGRGGRLDNGIPLNEGQHLYVKSSSAGNHFGTAELVSMIEHAARHVADHFPNSQLAVGDLSREGGGHLRKHRSHRSGRDVDIGFYFLDENGQPFHPQRFLPVSADGTGVDAQGNLYRFDVARNWALLRSMLVFDQAAIQYVFVSRPLQALLLAHAEQAGESPEMLARAAEAMSHHARGHDNHFHVRIHCPSTDDRCVDREPPRRSRRGRGGRARGTVHVTVEAP